MNETQLLECAESAFAAIAVNTGKSYWLPGDGLRAAATSFQDATDELGLAGLIDAATGSGMSHIGLAFWLEQAKSLEV